MAIIVLSVYKTCNKYYETRRRNYMPIQRGDFLDFNTNYDAAQYPSPPPPYMSDNENIVCDSNNNSSNEQQTNDAPPVYILNRNSLDATTVATTELEQPLTRSGFETPPPEYEEDSKTALHDSTHK